MIGTATVTKIIDAPSDKVWAAIRSIGGLDRWFPVINSCRVEGEGVGAVRILGLADGGEMRDRLLEIDDAERRVRYQRFQSPFPVESYIGTVEVREKLDRRSEVSWNVQIEVAADKVDDLAAFLETALSDGIDGLERDIRSTNDHAHRQAR